MNGLQPDISIIIPTYHRQERILVRTIAAIERQELADGTTIECVIVDNRSDPPVAELGSVKEFLNRNPWARIIQEPRQGLTYARLAGFKATSAASIIVLDDDSVARPDYAKTARRLLHDWPSVGIWGPGRISVEFIDPVAESFKAEFRALFNERQTEELAFGCVPGTWMPYYPAGIGQVMRREVADRYASAVADGILTSADRSGDSLTSAGDVQIVWETVKMGLAAGVHPDLALSHLIPAQRCNIRYAKRLAFGCCSSYLPAFVQSFPSERAKMTGSVPSSWEVLKGIAATALREVRRGRFSRVVVEIAAFLGTTLGRLRASGKQPQRWILALVRFLDLE